MASVADVLVHALTTAGVDTVFGLPGGENVEVLDAIRRAGVQFVLVHHESSAVFMADATARLTGKPGVCLTTLGPGAANSVAGVAHAFLDRAPVLIISAQVPARLRPEQTHQNVDLNTLFRPITKASIECTPDGAEEIIHAALDLVRAGRPGPVHLQISNEDAGKEITANQIVVPDKQNRKARPEAIASAIDLLKHARRPIIVAGLGLEPEGPYHELQTLAQAASAPIITTPKAKGCLPEDHPLVVGSIGLTKVDSAYEVLDEADCIIAVGFDVVELVKQWKQSAPLIWIAAWENQDPKIDAQVEIVASLKPVLHSLSGIEWSTDADWGATRVARYRDMLSAHSKRNAKAGRLLPQDVLEAMRTALPRDVIYTTDVGSHKIFSCVKWPSLTPNSFLVSNGLSCMGFGLPAAIAASIACPDRTIACVIGDAGMAMSMGELAVLARLQNPIVIVVLKDGALDLIRTHQHRAGKPTFGTEFNAPDFVQIAKAYGMDAFRATTREHLFNAVSLAIGKSKPVVIEALIDPSGYFEPHM